MTAADSLKGFLTEHGITREQIAKALDVSRTVIYFWLEKGVVPKLKTRRDIEVYTKGAVPAGMWGSEKEAPTAKPFDEPVPESAPAPPPAEPEPEHKDVA